MRTILTPTDFSDNAFVATKYAVELARRSGQRVKLFHSYIKLYTGYDGSKGAEKLISQSQQNAKTSMEALLNALQREYPDVEIIGECKGGYAGDSIIQKILDESYSIVIMGSKGITSTADKLLGSTTYEVINRTPIPILAIPKNSPDFSLDKIGFFTTYQEADINALLRLRHTLGTGLNIQMTHLYTSSLEPIEKSQKWERKIKTEFPNERFTFRTARVTGINAGVVAHIAKNENLNLLVFTRLHKPFLNKIMSRSLTRDVANHINIPTLFVNG